jgi:hypothetical protein
MTQPHGGTPAQIATSRCPPLLTKIPLVEVLEIVGDLKETPDDPRTEGANEVIRQLALRIHKCTGLRQADILEAIDRLPWGEGLDGATAPASIDLGPYSLLAPAQDFAAEYDLGPQRRDLSHVLTKLRELDKDGTAATLGRWLWDTWPLLREIWHNAAVAEAGTTTLRRSEAVQAARALTTTTTAAPQAATSAVKQLESKQPPSAKPHWEETCRQLFLGDKMLRTYRRHAGSQFIVLAAFEAAGWPLSIPNPLGRRSVKDTLAGLNNGLLDTRLRFQRGGEDTAIRWMLLPV